MVPVLCSQLADVFPELAANSKLIVALIEQEVGWNRTRPSCLFAETLLSINAC
jgi:hypothetical protein